jgi:predicted dehydrogenase
VTTASVTHGADGPIGVAVVGVGYWGPNLVRNLMASPSFRLRWLCDLDRSRAERVLGYYGNATATTDLTEVLADSDVQAVVVATPADTHLGIALAALRAGKHVLAEKPLAATYADGRRIVDEAEGRGLILMCDHTFCYTPAVARVRELLHSGDLGEIQYFDSVRINFGPVRRDVDVVWDLVPHDISILDHVLPDGVRPVSVSAMGTDPIGLGKCSIAYLNLTLSNGSIAHIHANWLSPLKVRSVTVGGSKRTVVWNHLDPMYRLSIFDRGVDVALEDDLADEERRNLLISYRSGDMVAPAVPDREPLALMIDEFARAMTTGTTAMTDGHAGLRMLRILEATSYSIAQHGAIIDLER